MIAAAPRPGSRGAPATSARRDRRRVAAAAAPLFALVALLALPSVVLGHPLGNFTINHYAGLRVTPTEIQLDVVIDQAEIPTFQERLDIDQDGDGEISAAESQAARAPRCEALAADLQLTIDGAPVPLDLTTSGLQFPSGAGGLATMRLVCGFVAPIEGGIGIRRTVAFADSSFPDRLGWREIVVQGDGTTIAAEGDVLATSASRRLAAYPDDLLQAPLSISAARFTVTPGGPTLPPFAAPDAQPVGGRRVAATTARPPAAAVPGGVPADIPDVFRAPDVSPGVLLAAIATALALGAGHALTPGHGKTLMATYLVGTRGTAVHAVGLGLSVTVSHTLGILALAALVVAAQEVLAPDAVVRWLPVAAAVTIVAIGAWMVAAELGRLRAAGRLGHDHDHGHSEARFVHTHAGVHHSHAHRPGRTVTWSSLFALGLAGGVIPSTSALLILLGTIAAGRPALGVVLVVAFGLGMAVALAGVGLLVVRGRALLDRLPARSPLARAASWAPLAAAVVVLGLGVWLTGQAVGGRTVL